MHKIDINSDDLVESLLSLPKEYGLCLLDSCGVSYQNSHLLIAGISPKEVLELKDIEPSETLKILDERTSTPNLSAILTISYDFGLRLNSIKSKFVDSNEPDVFLALFDCLIIHDYKTSETYLIGCSERFSEIENALHSAQKFEFRKSVANSSIRSDFTRAEYIKTIDAIKELIRTGDTYQTNLTQQINAILPTDLSPEEIFLSLRRSHPAPFSAFIRRKKDIVISASPERFLRVEGNKIVTNPIKGTRPRGATAEEDLRLQNELLASEKDRAENIMIVDLLRNDIGRVCEFGSVEVEKLCELERHASLFHLVSTVSGTLRRETKASDILNAAFPCGSITGAPKIRTMQIIDDLENSSRGLSMGAIGFANGGNTSIFPNSVFDLSVAIRTMVIRDRHVTFNVGGGIVIDSDPQSEYEETLTKAKALLNAISANGDDLKA